MRKLIVASIPLFLFLFITNIAFSQTTLEAPAEVNAGAEFKVKWTGPDNKGDFITIVEAKAEGKKYGNYKYTKRGNVLTLRALDKPGAYEIRYLDGNSYATLDFIPITVLETPAALEAPSEATAGSDIKVIWTGPDNKQDFITIVETDTEERKYSKYIYTSRSKEDKNGKSYITLKAPDEAGLYEVRYLTGQKYNTLARVPLTVTATTATLDAPKQVIANEIFKVSWIGPGNDTDFIAIYESDIEDAKYTSYAYTRRGNPLKIQAPKKPGIYEIRYLTGQSEIILSTTKTEVLQSNEPGSLKVISSSTGTASTSGIGAVELILDASGSMLKKLNGIPRITIAKDAVINLVNSTLEPQTPFALRVFGHKEADSCRTDLEIPLTPLNKNSVVSNVESIQAKNLAKTPIAKSLNLISEDLAGVEGKVIIILLTDGEETCEGDPKLEIQKLKDSGYDVRVNIVGFAIDELMLKETFREWARIGNGSYFDASNAEELAESIQKAIEIPFEIIDSSGEVAATGVLNGKSVEVPAGIYSVNVLLSPAKTIEDIVIEPKAEKEIVLE